ncbi:MAG: hypothetical protein HUU38_27155 [Anaerolineales bacterium]|nr:hypothetical protein [Anaerolineales bacterium]
MKPTRSLSPLLLFTLLLLPFLLTACKQDPNEEFLQGIWEFANEAGDERSGRVHLFYRWQFSDGTFYVEQEIVMSKPSVSEGRYRILESSDNLIVLELFAVEGTFIPSDPYELRIEINREDNTARFQRTLFNRVWP